MQYTLSEDQDRDFNVGGLETCWTNRKIPISYIPGQSYRKRIPDRWSAACSGFRYRRPFDSAVQTIRRHYTGAFAELAFGPSSSFTPMPVPNDDPGSAGVTGFGGLLATNRNIHFWSHAEGIVFTFGL